MAHFAEIDGENRVIRVLVVSNEREARGAEYLANDLGLGGTWVQTSYSGSTRRRFAGVGFTYDAARDAFIEPRPYDSWTLDAVGDWQPPVAMPTEGACEWDETAGAWVEPIIAAE